MRRGHRVKTQGEDTRRGHRVRARYLGQPQGVDEVHGDVGLRQVDHEPGGHVEQGHLQGDRDRVNRAWRVRWVWRSGSPTW